MKQVEYYHTHSEWWFYFSYLLVSWEYKALISEPPAKFRPRWVVPSFVLFRVSGVNGDTSMHLFTPSCLSLLWKWLWLSVIIALNARKLFNPPNTALAKASNSLVAFLNRFLQCKTEPHNLQHFMTDDVYVFFGILLPDIVAEEHMFAALETWFVLVTTHSALP